MNVPAEYFDAAMGRLCERFLNVPLEAVLHPLTMTAQQVVREQQASAGSAQSVQLPELNAGKWFEQGLKNEEAMNIDEAIQCYTEAIRLNPDYALAYKNRGNMRGREGDLDGVIQDHNEAFRLLSEQPITILETFPIQFKPNNNLGKGIRIGGIHDNLVLMLVGTDWQRFHNNGWVASGWLYTPDQLNKAITFFKIHLWDAGDGYIHLMDVANPKHTVWVETATNFRKEEEFCWDNDRSIQRTAKWEFKWQ
jgi:tetratricopeptide (TPR) repeat protein